MKNKIDSLISKIKIHIETTEECIENFNIDNTTQELLSQDNKFLKEIQDSLVSLEIEEELYTKYDIINAAHQVEIEDDKDYSKLINRTLQNLK